MNNEFENENETVIEVQTEPRKQKTAQKYGNPIVLLSVISAFALMFLSRFLTWLIDNANADRILGIIFFVFIFGCVATAFTVILLNYRKTGKTIFSLETVLALMALFLLFFI